MATRIVFFISIIGLLVACASEDRTCFKGHGEEVAIEIPLDSVGNWVMNKKIKYRIFQDSSRKLVVKGGANMVQHVSADYHGDTLEISNNNKCDFLRNADRYVEVEIHYPFIRNMYIEPSDSVIFENTITTDSIWIEMREAGGSMVLDVDVHYVSVIVSHGTANYVVSGKTYKAIMKVQHNGYGDASQLDATSYFAYQNSTGDLYIDIDDAGAIIAIDGVGDVYAKGNPVWLIRDGQGTGDFLIYE